MATNFGIRVKKFNTDNGIFTEEGFKSNVSENNHTISYCKVGRKERLYNLWPLMLHMDQHCPFFLCEFFNGNLGYSVLKFCSDFEIADCVVIL